LASQSTNKTVVKKASSDVSDDAKLATSRVRGRGGVTRGGTRGNIRGRGRGRGKAA